MHFQRDFHTYTLWPYKGVQQRAEYFIREYNNRCDIVSSGQNKIHRAENAIGAAGGEAGEKSAVCLWRIMVMEGREGLIFNVCQMGEVRYTN